MEGRQYHSTSVSIMCSFSPVLSYAADTEFLFDAVESEPNLDDLYYNT